jgi:3-hydroxybutyryl-CoA dehydrogenase
METLLYDKFPEALERCMVTILGWLTMRVESGGLTAKEAESAPSRLHPCETLAECVGSVQLVIENVPENLRLKRDVFAQIDGLALPHTLIATNSSSIPCSRMADGTQRPEKVFSVNFGDPTQDDHVEVMKGAATTDETLAAGLAFLRSLGMVPIVTYKEIMGFSFNRVWRAIKRERLHLVDQSYCTHEDLDRAWMLNFGKPPGPFGLMDNIGLDVVRDIEMQYYLDSGSQRDRPPRCWRTWVGSGLLGGQLSQGMNASVISRTSSIIVNPWLDVKELLAS